MSRSVRTIVPGATSRALRSDAASRPAKPLRKKTDGAVKAGQNGSGSEGEPSSAPDIVYEHILEGLYRGQYAPGQRLIEADISRRCGVSRGPIREAFRRLAGEGLLSLTLNRGAYVRSLTVAEALDTLVVVEALLRTTARLAATRIDEGDNREIYARSARAFLNFQRTGDLRAYIEARATLTTSMLEVAGNAELTRVMSVINMTLLRVHFIPFGGEFEQQRAGQYQAIVKAVLAGDAAAAERAVSRHVRSVSADIVKMFGAGAGK